MGDIIKVDFGGNVSEKKNTKPQRPLEVTDLSAEVLPFTPKLAGEKDGLASFEQVTVKLRSLNEFLRGIRAPRSDTAALRQQMVARMTFLEICNVIAYSSETEWLAHPAYFRALADEFWIKFATKSPASGPKLFTDPSGEPENPEDNK